MKLPGAGVDALAEKADGDQYWCVIQEPEPPHLLCLKTDVSPPCVEEPRFFSCKKRNCDDTADALGWSLHPDAVDAAEARRRQWRLPTMQHVRHVRMCGR